MVKLNGRAAAQRDREAAAQIARGVPGVASVANDLVVQAAQVQR